jgi:TRAP-type transport system periplasmic protein
MDGTKNRRRLAGLCMAVTAAFAMAACSGSSSAGEDKAGGSNPLVLRLANTNGDLSFTPAVEYFVKHLEEISGGGVRIEVVDEWGGFASDAEQQVVEDVSAGEVDLGWVGTRVFDTLGTTSFQALTTPMLIDSYPLQNAVIEAGITEEMMPGLDSLGVAALGVVPDGLRKPIGVDGPILSLADWQGLTFGTLLSDGQAEAIRALGATSAQVNGTEREAGLADGTIRGFETSIWVHQHNPSLPRLAPYVTSNVTLWPQMDVLLANPERLEELTAEHREWLEEAAQDAATRSAALADKDAHTISNSCAAGARFAEASAADLAALEAAFAPVYANLQQHPETKAFISRIQALKESTPPGPELAIPTDCTGTAPEQAADEQESAPAHLNGTYRYTLTEEDARTAGEEDLSRYPHTNTYVLKDGHFDATGGFTGSYSVAGNRIIFRPTDLDFDYTVTFTFTVDDEGNIDLDPVPGTDPGDAFEAGSHTVWTKID